MKMILKLIFLIYFLFISEIALANLSNRIILKIENEIVTSYEIKNKILNSLILTNQEVNQKNINKLKKTSIESLIQLKLKRIELSKHNISYTPAQMQNYLNQISSNDINGLKNKFSLNNLDYEIFYKEIETQLKWQSLIYKLYSNKIEINENDLEDEIKKILQNQKKVVEYRISEIEILDNDKESGDFLIKDIKKNIAEQGFAATAVKFSISSSASNKGDLGWVNANSLSKDIYKLISKMNLGDVSAPIKRTNSILFLKLDDKKEIEAGKIETSKLKKKLIEQKKNELFNLYSRSHLSKLRNSSFIEYK